MANTTPKATATPATAKAVGTTQHPLQALCASMGTQGFALVTNTTHTKTLVTLYAVAAGTVGGAMLGASTAAGSLNLALPKGNVWQAQTAVGPQAAPYNTLLAYLLANGFTYYNTTANNTQLRLRGNVLVLWAAMLAANVLFIGAPRGVAAAATAVPTAFAAKAPQVIPTAPAK